MGNAAAWLEKHWEKWIPEPNSGCYLWVASCNPRNGRPVVWFRNKVCRPARIVCEMEYGELPKHIHARHFMCCTGMCVNPDHIKPGTATENLNDELASTRSEWSKKAYQSYRRALANGQ